jgi:hypothetical protein
MSARDDKVAERLLVDWPGGRSQSAAASGGIAASRHRPGWRWNGKQRMSGARYLDAPQVRILR